MSEENLAHFIDATDAFNRLGSDVGNLNEEAIRKWLDSMDPEVRFEPQQAALQGTYRGQQGALQWLADLAEHYERGRVEYAEVHDLGNRVLGLGAIHVVGRGSGIETDVPAAILMTFRDGLITQLQDFGGDRARALEAAGLSESARAMSEENVEVVERLIVALNERDVDQYLALCTPDVEYISPTASIEGVHRGEEGLRALFSTIAEAATSFRIEVEQVRALNDDRVLALTRLIGESKGGVPWKQPTASLYDFAGAKVRRVEIFLDQAKALKAAGLSE